MREEVGAEPHEQDGTTTVRDDAADRPSSVFDGEMWVMNPRRARTVCRRGMRRCRTPRPRARAGGSSLVRRRATPSGASPATAGAVVAEPDDEAEQRRRRWHRRRSPSTSEAFAWILAGEARRRRPGRRRPRPGGAPSRPAEGVESPATMTTRRGQRRARGTRNSRRREQPEGLPRPDDRRQPDDEQDPAATQPQREEERRDQDRGASGALGACPQRPKRRVRLANSARAPSRSPGPKSGHSVSVVGARRRRIARSGSSRAAARRRSG